MPSFNALCPRCKKQFACPSTSLGRWVACIHCGMEFAAMQDGASGRRDEGTMAHDPAEEDRAEHEEYTERPDAKAKLGLFAAMLVSIPLLIAAIVFFTVSRTPSRAKLPQDPPNRRTEERAQQHVEREHSTRPQLVDHAQPMKVPQGGRAGNPPNHGEEAHLPTDGQVGNPIVNSQPSPDQIVIRGTNLEQLLSRTGPNQAVPQRPMIPGALLLPPGTTVEVPGKLLKEVVPGYETRDVKGFKVLLSTQAIREAKAVGGAPFKAIEDECETLSRLFPARTLKALQKVLIWVEWDRMDKLNFRNSTGKSALAMFYGGNIWHLDPGEHLLKSNAIEVLSLKSLSESKTVGSSKCVLLHEMSHAVHFHVLGMTNQSVEFAYRQAMDRRLYENVKDQSGRVGPAYAATNSAEYFAELTCAFLDRADYYPFNRAELQEYDPTGFRVMQAVWEPADNRKSLKK